MNSFWRFFRFAAGLVLGLGLCAGLFVWAQKQNADWSALWRQFSPSGFFGLIGLSYLLMLFSARKWALLASALHGKEGHEPTPGFFLRHTLWQNWIGQFVPPALAVVLGRSLAARAMENGRARDGFAGGLWDQGIEYAFFMGLVPAGVAFLWGHVAAPLFFLLALLGTLAAAGTCSALVFFFQKKLWHIVPLLLFLSLGRVALTLARLILGSFVLGFTFDPVALIASGAVVALIALIPATPGNLGLAEWGWVGALTLAGEDPAQTALFALGFRLLVLFAQTLLVVTEKLVPRAKAP